MSDINFDQRWRETMIGLAADDERVKLLAYWLLGMHGEYNDCELMYEQAAKSACSHYGLDAEEDLHYALELSEQYITEELNNG